MERRRPPVLGRLEQVVPVVQEQRRGPWTLTLVSLERWSNCFAASFDLLRAGPIDRAERLHPWLAVEAVDAGGRRHLAWFGGGFGGGLRDGGEKHRLVTKFTPPIDDALSDLRLTTRLQLQRQADGFPPKQVTVWEDPEPWSFLVSLTAPPRPVGQEGLSTLESQSISTDRRTSSPPELRRLLDVVPIAETKEANGWAITLISIERYEDGFRLVYRLLGAEKAPMNPLLRPRIIDDRGNIYAVWDGGGNGEPSIGACHWRMSSFGTPALDPASRELVVEISEVQATTFEPEKDRPNQGQMVVSGTDAVDWQFSVRLR